MNLLSQVQSVIFQLLSNIHQNCINRAFFSDSVILLGFLIANLFVLLSTIFQLSTL